MDGILYKLRVEAKRLLRKDFNYSMINKIGEIINLICYNYISKKRFDEFVSNIYL